MEISAKKAVITSFIVDISDVVLSLLATILTGSVIMLSQLLEGAADLTSSGLLLLGVQRAKRVEDKTHPFGYGREVYFWTLLSALVMFGVTATFSVYFGVVRFLYPEPIRDLPLAYTVLIISVFTNGYAFWVSLQRLLQKHHPRQIARIFFQSSLVETKTTLILDLMGLFASILGLISLWLYQVSKEQRFDGLGAILIGLFLGFFAYLLVRAAKDLLIGRAASPEVEVRIKRSTLSIPQVKDVLGMKTMHLGPEKLLVHLDVNLQGRLTTAEIEKLVDDIKKKVQEDTPTISHIQVELETPRS